MATSDHYKDNPNTTLTSLLYDIGILKDKQPNPDGAWHDRPIDDKGKQVEDGDAVAIRCVIKKDPSFFQALGAVSNFQPVKSVIEGVGDVDNLKGNGEWLTTKDKDGDGGDWYTVVDGTSDAAAPMIVRRVDTDPRLHLELRGKGRVMTNHGHWINSYTFSSEDYPSTRNITFKPTEYGYQMHFQSADRAVTYSDYLNVKGSGDDIYFVFINLGHVDDYRVEVTY